MDSTNGSCSATNDPIERGELKNEDPQLTPETEILEKKLKVDTEGNDSAKNIGVKNENTSVAEEDTESQRRNGAEDCKEGAQEKKDMENEDKPVTQEEPPIELKVIFNKKSLPIVISLSKTVGELKKKIEELTKVSPALQKVLIKGIPKDDIVLKSLGLKAGSKIMVIGSSLDEVMSMAKPPEPEKFTASEHKEPHIWCTMPQHKKVIDKGIPEEAMPGILNVTDPLPPFPIHGMVTSKGSKVRLTFKLEQDELWIGTKERTEKVQISSIKNVSTQPITGYEHYHILAIQLGPTSASNFYVYWVPAQYVEAIKDTLGG